MEDYEEDPFENTMTESGGIDYYNIPCPIEEAANMLRVPLRKNEPPYTLAVKKLNNRLVDEYHDVILRPMANKKGTVPSGKVCIVWDAFQTGTQICNIVPIADMIVRPDAPQFSYWIRFLRQDIDKLYQYGMIITMVWGLVMSEIRHRVRLQKWERIYSHPVKDWHRLFNKEKMLLMGELQLPCTDIGQEGLKEIEEKLSVLQKLYLHIPAEQKIEKNDAPYVRTVKELNNAQVADFKKLFSAVKLPPNKKENAPLTPEEKKRVQMWNFFREGRQLNAFSEHLINLPRATHEQFLFWGKFLQKDIEELHPYGGHLVSIGHGTLLNEVRLTMSEKKIQRIFSFSEDEWEELFKKNWDYLTSKPDYPFEDVISEEELKEASEKLKTLQQIRVDPNNSSATMNLHSRYG